MSARGRSAYVVGLEVRATALAQIVGMPDSWGQVPVGGSESHGRWATRHAAHPAALNAGPGWNTLAVEPMRMVETSPGEFSLMLDAGTTDVDEVIEELGHEPNGYFWEGIAQLLVDTEAQRLEGRFEYDPEGDMFVAHGSDRPALDELATLMTAVATDADRLRSLVGLAEDRGFEFDD